MNCYAFHGLGDVPIFFLGKMYTNFRVEILQKWVLEFAECSGSCQTTWNLLSVTSALNHSLRENGG